MMSSEPQPSSTAENRRFSITAVTAIHQRRENAVAREGAMMEMGREGQGGEGGGCSLKDKKQGEEMRRGSDRCVFEDTSWSL
ncbi:hypothetical protein CesoFtcFv8_005805 [Champsocephalus esox]|uniref:Uncharacterized protein n=1 Tax=Champsocephalus esox TaxID=159716 RepID=A0AAN8H682_9TELE|nr:hypothetical protein CesoFtcFv8_005805 [Champsocephalus esox]